MNPEQESNKCSGCGCETDGEFHTCPLREEMNGDEEFTCTCCPKCTAECVMDI